MYTHVTVWLESCHQGSVRPKATGSDTPPQCCYGYLVTVPVISSSSFCTRILKSWFKMIGRKLMIEWILSTFSKFCREMTGRNTQWTGGAAQLSLQGFFRSVPWSPWPPFIWPFVSLLHCGGRYRLKGLCLISNSKYILIFNYFCFG